MKTAIYFSGVMLEFQLIGVFPILVLVLFLLVFLLIIIDKYLYNRKIKKIIDSYKGTDKKTIQLKKGKSRTKGWGMNNSPFTERKSGLTWGGGNIKGANATRGTRKAFLK